MEDLRQAWLLGQQVRRVEPARDDASVRLDSALLPQSIGHCCLIFAPYGDISCGDVPL